MDKMDNSNSSAGSFEGAPREDVTESARSVDDALGNVTRNAPWNQGEQEGNIGTSGPVTGDYEDLENPGTNTIDEEFAGTGSVPTPP